MRKITDSDLTDLYNDLCDVRDNFTALEFAYSEMCINFSRALAIPVDRFRELCEIFRKMITQEKGACADE